MPVSSRTCSSKAASMPLPSAEQIVTLGLLNHIDEHFGASGRQSATDRKGATAMIKGLGGARR